MIDFYTWSTPNGRKVAIMLEESGLDYKTHPVNLAKQEQFSEDFLKVAPNNKIPAIVDHDVPGGPVSVFESGAILTYLGDKSGQFLSKDPAKRAQELQWLFWQMAGYGPMLGQLYHFAGVDRDDAAYGLERFTNEASRLHDVLDAQLADNTYVAGDYSIADMAILPWTIAGLDQLERRTGKSWKNVHRWMDQVRERPAVSRGLLSPGN